jgi:large subunit ribosomal protein L4
MATLDVVTIDNQKAGSVDLDPAVFDAPVRAHLMHAEVRRQLALRRAGTHSTKNRAAVSGGGAKPWRQKGTGRARQGTIRAPQWAGGGVVFGPVPRAYAHKLPKKVRSAALRSAISQRTNEGGLTILDSIELAEFKTKRIAAMLDALGLSGEKVLLVLDEANPHVEQSARNLPRVTVIRVAGLNVYDVARHNKLVVTKGAVEALAARLAVSAKGASS